MDVIFIFCSVKKTLFLQEKNLHLFRVTHLFIRQRADHPCSHVTIFKRGTDKPRRKFNSKSSKFVHFGLKFSEAECRSLHGFNTISIMAAIPLKSTSRSRLNAPEGFRRASRFRQDQMGHATRRMGFQVHGAWRNRRKLVSNYH